MAVAVYVPAHVSTHLLPVRVSADSAGAVVNSQKINFEIDSTDLAANALPEAQPVRAADRACCLARSHADAKVLFLVIQAADDPKSKVRANLLRLVGWCF